jgi:GAF domain-containing protein/HAMP domain-containing protein
MSQSQTEKTQSTSEMRSASNSIQTRLVLFVLLTALIPLVIISTLNSTQTRQSLITAAEVSLETSAQQTANSLDAYITTTLEAIRVESELSDFSAYLEAPITGTFSIRENRAKELLGKLASKDPTNILSYGLVNLSGTVMLDTLEGNVGKNESRDEYFTRVRISNQPIVTAVTYLDDKTAIIVFASNIYNKDNRRVGILRVKYKSNILQEVIFNSIGKTPDKSVILLDQLNIRMADTRNPELILKSIAPLSLVDYSVAVNARRFLSKPREEQATNLPEFAEYLKNAKQKSFFRTDINPNDAGDDSVAVAFLQTQPWSVAYIRPTSIFLADAQKQTQNNTILVIVASILVTILATLIARTLSNPIVALANVADSISQGNLHARANISSSDEIGVLASAFNTMTDQLQVTLVGLEQRINERTAALQKYTLELETIADVGRDISIIRDLDTLLNVSVDLIRERFSYYHVAIYLIDERNEYAILRAASSVAAEQLLANNYKLRVGQTGVIGNVTRTGQAYIALDTGTDAVFFDNPYLPETRSEITLPLRSHNVTIGALDIQANVPTAFNEKDIQSLQILADQLASAIENAQLTQQIEGSLSALTIANRLQTEQIWRSTIDRRERFAFEYDGLQTKPIPQSLSKELVQQLEAGRPVVVKETKDANRQKNKNSLLVPLIVLNHVIGVIGLEKEDAEHTWTQEEIAVALAAANRAALTLENARLLEESKRRAVKERTIFEATARIGSALNMENILRTTAEELEKVIGGSEVTLQFQADREQKTEG